MFWNYEVNELRKENKELKEKHMLDRKDEEQ